MGWPNETIKGQNLAFPEPWQPRAENLPGAIPRPKIRESVKIVKNSQSDIKIDFSRKPLVESKSPKEKSTLAKRALSKFYSINLAKALADVPGSKLKGQYIKSSECAQDIIIEGDKVTSNYCGYRWCRTCNRIRAAKLIDKYSFWLDAMQQPYFVTLSLRNVSKAADLKETNKFILHTAHQIKDTLRKAGLVLYGFRKFEITINSSSFSFHPHLHFILDAKIKQPEHLPEKYKSKDINEQAIYMLQDIWIKYRLGIFDLKNILDRYKKSGKPTELAAETFKRLWLVYTESLSSYRAQDARPANKASLKELFKYGVKTIVKDKSTGQTWINESSSFINEKGDIITKQKRVKQKASLVVNLTALNSIYESIQGLRTLQSFGYSKAETAEFNELAAGGIEENLKAQDYGITPPETTEQSPQIIYTWQQWNWHEIETGQPLTDYEPGKYEARLIDSLEKARDKLKESPG